MFDIHYGAHDKRNMERQQFLNAKRYNKTKYGDQREGFICDMIINSVNDRKCANEENITRIKIK